MNNAISSMNVSTCLENEIAPIPSAIPGEFVVRLGDGWGGPLHDPAGELERHELGAEAAAAGLLAWIEFIEVEVQELEGFEDLLDRLRLLRGAVMTAGAAVSR